MSFLTNAVALLGGLLIFGYALADFEEDYATKQWEEVAVQMPTAPRDQTLQAFYVSAASENQFLIDLATLRVDKDGVVRYVLLVLTPNGGRNVTFEGLRCETRERRIYASGRRDGSWSKSRNGDWSRIQEVYANRHHAALFLDYFCPGGVIVRNAEEARNALRLGGHSDNKPW